MESTITMKGAVAAVLTLVNTVQVWVQSPTGDSSDCHIYDIPCDSVEQAKFIAAQWQKVWGLDEDNNRV